MKTLLLMLLLCPGAARAEDSFLEKVEKDYLQPAFDQIAALAHAMTDPNANPGVPVLPQAPGPMGPVARKTVDLVQKSFVDPVGAKLGSDAGSVAQALASSDVDGQSPEVEPPAIDLDALVRQVTAPGEGESPRPVASAELAPAEAPPDGVPASPRIVREFARKRLLKPSPLTGQPSSPKPLKPLRED